MTRRCGHRRHLGQGAHHERGRHVVGEVRDQAPGACGPLGQEPGQIELQGVSLDDLDAHRLDHRAQHREHVAVRLDRHHAGAGLGQGQRQGAQAGSDLEHVASLPRRPRGGRCAAPYSDRRRSSDRGPDSGGSRAPTAVVRCRHRNGSPGDCDLRHSLAQRGDLPEAFGRQVDHPRVARVLAVVDRARGRRAGCVVRHRQHRPERQGRTGAIAGGCRRVPRRLARF